MNLILFDLNEGLCREWASQFFGADTVKVLNKGLNDVVTGEEFDGIVSPANSFGIMDGGIDKPLAEAFPAVQANVTSDVNDLYRGYIPVGNALVVNTDDDTHPFLIVAPTMPYPKALSDPFVVYDVTRALLLEADLAGINTLAIPGLATATGRVQPKVAAGLMRIAWEHHERGSTSASNWDEASKVINDILLSVQ